MLLQLTYDKYYYFLLVDKYSNSNTVAFDMKYHTLYPAIWLFNTISKCMLLINIRVTNTETHL